jgi:ribosome-associated protein
MIHINNDLFIPESEIAFAASRSGGPGGQNVNKVSTRVTLSFDVNRSAVLSESQKEQIFRRLASRINKGGVLRIISQKTRSQATNRTDAMARFAELLRRALTPAVPRIKTRSPKAAKERRLESKKKRTLVKQARSKKGWD